MSEAAAPPRLLDRWDRFVHELAGRRPVVFLDFDGTLSPIVERPDDAAILPANHRAVERLAERVPVIVVSGRGREDVAARVGLPELVYAGSHGFDIAGPEGSGIRHTVGEDLPPLVERVTARLEERLAAIPGVELEPKRFTVAIHYRRVPEAQVDAVQRVVGEVAGEHPELAVGHGKKVLEVRPSLDWDKGKALLFLLEELGLDGEDVVPLYVGDDVTDEDAFRELARREGGGVGVRVVDEGLETRARWAVGSVEEVGVLLERLRDSVAEDGVVGGGGEGGGGAGLEADRE